VFTREFSSSSKRRVSRRRHHRVSKHYVGSKRSALRRCKECIEPTHSEVLEELRKTRVVEYSREEFCKCALSEHKECISEPKRGQDPKGRPMQGVH
jgi:hypothetical protein